MGLSSASPPTAAATPCTAAAAFEFFRELPPEIVSEKILSQFCDEKSLSTLALACAAAANNDEDDDDDENKRLSCYERLVYGIVPTIARERLLQQALTIAGEKKEDETKNIHVQVIAKKNKNTKKDVSNKKYEGIVKWIRTIAAVDNSVYTCNTSEDEEEEDEDHTDEDEDKEDHVISLREAQFDDSKPLPIPSGKALAEQLRQTKQYRKLKAMRRLSENLAVAHFLRNSIEQSCNGHWEYTVWVGQLSVVTNIADAACLRKTVRTAITAPMPLKGPPPSCHNIIPGASLMHTHRTPTGFFRLEPYNLLRPLPPWGRVKGLAASDQALLQDLAATLDNTSGGSTICVPCPRYNQRVHNDPLDVRILTQRQAQSRIQSTSDNAGRSNNSRVPSRRSTNTEWIVTDPTHAQHPLVCCWHDDSVDDEGAEGDFVAYVICLLKTQERLLRQDHC